MKRVLCIWIPNWPVQRLLGARPELDGRPLVLHEPRRGAARVAARSDEAAALGIAVGMSLAEAEALAGTRLRWVEPYDPLADRAALVALADGCRQFSPVVGLEASTAPEGLLLDVTGVARLFGGEEALVQRVLDDFVQRRLDVRLAIADTLGAAWAAARFRTRELASPATIISPGGTAAAVCRLPIEALRLPEDTVDVLHQLGIFAIGPLAALPRSALASRFGPELLDRLAQLEGRVEETVCVCPPAPELVAARSLEYPTTRRATLQRLLEQLIDELADQLRRHGRGVLRLECAAWMEGKPGAPTRITVGLFQATASAKHLFELAWMQFERVWFSSPVASIRVEAASTAPLECLQRELFADGASARSSELAGLIDRLVGRLGRRAVLRPRLVRDAQPELAYRYEPLLSELVERRRRRDFRTEDLPPRPLRLLKRPIAIPVTSLALGGPPLGFELAGRRHPVVHVWGPERIETGWWRGRSVGRDYYRVETASGQRFWLFRRLRDSRWFLHGAS